MSNAPTVIRRSVLVVDDEAGMREALKATFQRSGWNVNAAGGVREAINALERGTFDLVVTDVRMGDGDGFEVLNMIQQQSPGTAVIMLTAFGTVPEAVQSMRSGAIDYLTKPISFEQLHTTAKRVIERAGAQAAPAKGNLGPKSSGREIVGRSPVLLRALERARAAASTDSDVLVEAESGTGKELLARFIHQSSKRKSGPFIAVNCAAVPESLLESELFGHAKGAFTGATAAKPGKFELADGGTLLLDEIGEMLPSLQPKLLRVLQEREIERVGETRSIRVNFRLIATTNASLGTMVKQGEFRSDLYYRLNVIPLALPPLRDRMDDVPVLAQHFAEKFALESGGMVPTLSPEFLSRLGEHCWPGNIRELSNFMRRVLSLHPGKTIGAAEFAEEFGPWMAPSSSNSAVPEPGTPIAVLERMHLESTLAATNGNRTRAAELLGISIRTMRNKIREYGLPPRSYA